MANRSQLLRAQSALASVARSLGVFDTLRGARTSYRRSKARRAITRAERAHALPERFVAFGGHGNGGLGDDLLCTVVAHELRQRSTQPVWMVSHTPQLFAHNSDVGAVLPPSPELVETLERRGCQLANAHYWDVVTQRAPRHIITAMCRHAGVRGPIALRPYLHLTAEERARGRLHPQQIVLQSTAANARWASGNKEWFVDRMVDVAQRLGADYRVVQLGHRDDPVLPGALDLRGQTTFREAAAILANSRFFVGLVGFLMHLARAVECRSVIVYGGNEAPEHSGYVCNENLFTALECSPCLRFHDCDFDRACMRAIAAGDVMRAVERLVPRLEQPLETTVIADDDGKS